MSSVIESHEENTKDNKVSHKEEENTSEVEDTFNKKKNKKKNKKVVKDEVKKSETNGSNNRLEEIMVISRVYDLLSMEFDDDEDDPHPIDKFLVDETIKHVRDYLKKVANETKNKEILNMIMFLSNSKYNDKELIRVLNKNITSNTLSHWRTWLSDIDKMCEMYNFEFN